ncbi:MAG: methyltransferase domain-containing protein [Pseudomonadota bacterium]
MELFDHQIRSLRAPRVKKLLPDADFLFTRAAEGIADRLDDVKRDFPRAAIVGACGGAIAEALRGRLGAETLIQLESAPPLAALASARAPEAETLTAPDETLPLEQGRLDAAIGGLTLHRANDPVGLLTQMRLALKPDGLLLAATFGGRTLYELRAAFAEAEAEVEGGVSPRVAPMGEVRDLGGLLQRAGFALPVADVDRFEVAYETPFHLMRDLRAMGEANALTQRRRTFSRRATFMRMAEIYAANFSRPDGRVTATFEIVFLTGWSPDASQPQPLRPGSAKTRLADALGTDEKSAGEKAGE